MKLKRWLGIASVAAAALFFGAAVESKGPVDDQSQVVLSALPDEAIRTQSLILAGGPFPHGKDGTVFGNREQLLPRRARGFYREYTVPTPGLNHRGARRIVCGGQQATRPEVCYYTADHYTSFRRIVP